MGAHLDRHLRAPADAEPGSAPGSFTIALVLRVALISFSVSAMMTSIVQPQLARLLASWLYAPRRSK
jgi:antibiotic biosynthesis monooxygenase (ABM) superfamily enzyme